MSYTRFAALNSALSDLNLSDPSDFLVALRLVETWPAPGQFTAERFEHDFPVVETLHPEVFNLRGRQASVDATWALLELLGGTRNQHGMTLSDARKEWLAVFRAAFDQGLINPIVFGAAGSFLLTIAHGNAAVPHAAHSAPARQTLLADVRRASPLGLMSAEERRLRRELPDTVTIYRGGRTDAGGDGLLSRASAGMHWALTPEWARSYMRGRGHQQTVAAIRNASLGLLAAHRFGAAQGPSLDHALGQPFVIRADVPKDLVLAYCVRGVDGEAPELLIDFERLAPDMLQDVTPHPYRRAA